MTNLRDKKTSKFGVVHFIAIIMGLIIAFVLGYSWLIDKQAPPLFVLLGTLWFIMLGISPLMPPKAAFLLVPIVLILYAVTCVETGVFNYHSTHISYQTEPVSFVVHVGLIVAAGIFAFIYILRAKPTSKEIAKNEKISLPINLTS